MKKLSKERLLYWVGSKINIINVKEGIVPSEEETQAYRQICQIIKLHFSEDWQQVKKDLGEFMKGKKPMPLRIGATFIDSDTEKVWKWDGKKWVEIEER